MRRLLALLVVCLALAGPWVWATIRDLPTGETLRAALDSCQIARYAGRDFALCPSRLAFNEFPRHLADALVAAEDRNFYDHPGVRVLSVFGAVAQNVTRSFAERRLVTQRGASTITQQFARTILLDERDGLSRKVSEVALALQIERMWSKRQILAGYMNVAPQARGLYGFDASARYFFGVPVTKIDLAEAAMLVGMLPAPNNRDPQDDPRQSFDAASRVLSRMYAQSRITLAQKQRAERELKSRLFGGRLKRGLDNYERFEFRPYRDLVLAEAARANIKLGDEYRLITAMDPRLQAWTVEETHKVPSTHQAAGVLLRPTGEVLAISGSRDYSESPFNRAYQAVRSIGSAGKLFLLVAVHEDPAILKNHFLSEPVLGDDWPAEPNRLCKGAMALHYAVAHSCNRPFTWLAKELGADVLSIVKRFDLTPPSSPLLVPLGGVSTSPLGLARAYAAVANGGRLPKIRALLAVLDRRGDVVYRAAGPFSKRIMSAQTAHAIHLDLRGPVRLGTARAANSKLALVVGKTGTSTDNRDAVFVGITQDYVGAFWVGNDIPTAMAGVHGGGLPARAFAHITDAYYAWRRNAGPPPLPVALQSLPKATITGLPRERQDQIAFAILLVVSGLLVRMLLRPRRTLALASANAGEMSPGSASPAEAIVAPPAPVPQPPPAPAPTVVAASPVPVMTATVVDMRDREGSGKQPVIVLGRG